MRGYRRDKLYARIQAIKAPSPLYMTQPPQSRSHTDICIQNISRFYRAGVLEYVSAIRDYIRTHA
jgi:hypothetical protein